MTKLLGVRLLATAVLWLKKECNPKTQCHEFNVAALGPGCSDRYFESDNSDITFGLTLSIHLSRHPTVQIWRTLQPLRYRLILPPKEDNKRDHPLP